MNNRMRSCAVGVAAFLALSTLAVVPAAADTASADASIPGVSVSTTATAGAFLGVAHEYIYDQNLATNYMVSELVWPLEPMAFAGATVSADTDIGLFGSLDVEQGFAGPAGTMTDSDFLNGDGVRTHYSQSTSYAERANLVELRLGWDLLSRSVLRVGAFGALSYMDLKWSARDGYYQYPTSGSSYTVSSGTVTPGTYAPWSASETETPLYGTGILYETTYLAAAAGVRARYALGDRFLLDASLAFAPIVDCYVLDNHVLRQLDFYSTLTRGFLVEPRVAVDWALLPSVRVKLDVGYRCAWNLRGNVTEVSTGASDFSTGFPYVAGPNSSFTGTNDSGADLSALDAGLSLSISM
ncbi:MAG TPA: omptin family outer membrane protease [Spirochaetia bacterium]|nr:omptin family outer membrane protease [Spirochaetia bacterium]